MLNGYRFLKDDHVRNVEVGPKLLALAEIADNRLPACVAQRAGEWLLGKDLSGPDAKPWIQELSRQFIFSGLSYRELVKAIVTDERYRSVQ